MTWNSMMHAYKFRVLRTIHYLLVFLLYTTILSCRNNKIKEDTLFSLISSEVSGITFSNNVKETARLNYNNFLYLVNGGGVGIGDFNNDGLDDIYFCSNLESNKLYINRGNFEFEDANSSFFWLLNKLHDVPVNMLYKSYTLQSLIMGVSGLIGVGILYLVGVR
jgi:hypothetical protein